MKENVVSLATTPVDRFANISASGLSESEQASLVKLALSVLWERYRPGELLTSSDATRDFLRLLLSERKNEVFGAMFLDTRHRVLCVEDLFHGTVHGASVHPRVVLQRAMECNAAAVIFYHNHPSGIAEPSMADKKITQRLKETLSLVDVRVLDHIIVGSEGTESFAERGLL
ncbi:MAG TPA: DNA repair protein RadC [Candidatus Tenderia sp.]|nr:DNA repair protein RadC [Candidatus Tenderia sp.]